MSKSFIPARDGDFDVWIENFADYCQAHAAELGLDTAAITAITGARGQWQTAYAHHNDAQFQARAKRQAKDDQKDKSEDVARTYARIIQARPQTTDEQRRALGLTVADAPPTPLAPDAVLTLTPPLIVLDWSRRGQCVIHFGPNPGNEHENGLPEGAYGARIEYHFGGVPAAEEEWQMLADDTNSPYVHNINAKIALTVAYRARYFDKRLRLGPFGDPVVATITQ